MTQLSEHLAAPQSSQRESIRRFWDERAQTFGTDQRATLGETYLRHVEIREVTRRLRRLRPASVLDVGCGNGFSTRHYAKAIPRTQFIGVDFSQEMIGHAAGDCPANCRFAVADVTDSSTLPRGPFDAILTQRCLQNLPDYEQQHAAIGHLLARRSAGGTLLLNECSKDGVAQLNGLRRRLGMEPIENIEPWHNCFMWDQNLVRDFDARIEHISSTYMLAAKIVHKKLAKWARFLPALPVRFGYDKLYVIRNVG